jgi:hypothetical protein
VDNTGPWPNAPILSASPRPVTDPLLREEADSADHNRIFAGLRRKTDATLLGLGSLRHDGIRRCWTLFLGPVAGQLLTFAICLNQATLSNETYKPTVYNILYRFFCGATRNVRLTFRPYNDQMTINRGLSRLEIKGRDRVE